MSEKKSNGKLKLAAFGGTLTISLATVGIIGTYVMKTLGAATKAVRHSVETEHKIETNSLEIEGMKVDIITNRSDLHDTNHRVIKMEVMLEREISDNKSFRAYQRKHNTDMSQVLTEIKTRMEK